MIDYYCYCHHSSSNGVTKQLSPDNPSAKGIASTRPAEFQLAMYRMKDDRGGGGGPKDGKCPPGYHRDPETGLCVPIIIKKDCPPGYTNNPITGQCVLISGGRVGVGGDTTHPVTQYRMQLLRFFKWLYFPLP